MQPQSKPSGKPKLRVRTEYTTKMAPFVYRSNGDSSKTGKAGAFDLLRSPGLYVYRHSDSVADLLLIPKNMSVFRFRLDLPPEYPQKAPLVQRLRYAGGAMQSKVVPVFGWNGADPEKRLLSILTGSANFANKTYLKEAMIDVLWGLPSDPVFRDAIGQHFALKARDIADDIREKVTDENLELSAELLTLLGMPEHLRAIRTR